MERKFPKNVRQIGNVCDTPKIYVEDYVDTYLNQLKERAEEEAVAAFLLGENQPVEGQECVCITGAVQIKDIQYEGSDLILADELEEQARAECKEYFPDKEIVGWFLIAPGRPMVVNKAISAMHERLCPVKNSIFVWKHAEEDEEIYFAYKYHELMQMGGYYIFYEKNPSMQNYMIRTRRQNGVTPSEVVEDRAAKDFRSAIREKMEVQEQKNSSRLVYITSALLVVMVLAIGISAMNNYDKMNSVQSSIETLSKSVQGTDDKEAKQPKEKKETSQESVAANSDAVVSTVEEDLSDQEYYTVQRGDTLDKISMKIYGTTQEAEAICKMNGLTDGNLIFIGQKLLLP